MFLSHRMMAGATGTAAAAGGYVIDQSIRFNDNNSAYMYRTPSVSGNRKTWTWSGWVKRGNLGTAVILFSAASSDADRTRISISSSDKMSLQGFKSSTKTMGKDLSRVFRDSSAFYHVVWAVDTTHATAASRVRCWINGVEETAFDDETNPPQNEDYAVNDTVAQAVGRFERTTPGNYFDGYLAEINFVDGAALTASSFGETDTNGNWVPKAYAGTDTTLDFITPDSYTNIGDMTAGGGLAAAFDGTTTHTSGTCANVAQGSDKRTYCGKDWGSGVTKTITGVTVWSHYTAGFDAQGSANTIHLELYGSNTAPTGPTDGTLLYDAPTFSDIAGAGGQLIKHYTEADGITTTTAYRYHWLAGGSPDVADGEAIYYSELRFFEDGTGYGTNGFHIDGADSADLGKDANVADLTVFSDAALFDGSDYLRLVGGPTGAADSTSFFYSGWVNFSAGGDAAQNMLFAGYDHGNTSYYRGTDNKFRFTNHDAAVTGNAIDIKSTSTYTSSSGWVHVLFSHNGTASHLYINGVDDKNVVTHTNTTYHGTYSSAAGFGVNLEALGGARLYGSAADIIFAQEYIDLSVQATREKFILASGAPAAWATALAAVTTPLVAFHLDDAETVANFADNADGTGQAFTITGALSSGASMVRIGANDYITSGLNTHDQFFDTPTDDAVNGVGNHCTFNPLAQPTTAGWIVLSDGNVSCTIGGTLLGAPKIHGTIGVSSGQWYWEVKLHTSANAYIGIDPVTSLDMENYVGEDTGYGYYALNGQIYNSASGSAYGDTYGSTDVIGIELDMDAGTLKFWKNGVSQGTAATGLTGTWVPAISGDHTNSAPTFEFKSGAGSGSFVQNYTDAGVDRPEASFLNLNTANLPAPAIKDPSAHFQSTLYVGNGATGQNVVQDGNTTFQPDLVWVRNRTVASGGSIYDSIRGETLFLQSTNANGDATDSADDFTGFNSDGFGVDNDNNLTNDDGEDFVGWQWKEGATPGFSIDTGSHTNGGGATSIAHSLGTDPEFIILKSTDLVQDWDVLHVPGMTGGKQCVLNTTAAETAVGSNQIGHDSGFIYVQDGAATGTYVAYSWVSIPGFSAFGSYTGNADADGPFVHCGFRPAYVILKRTDIGGAGFDWFIWDTERDTYNQMTSNLNANDVVAEGVTAYPLDAVSNGFKIRNSGTAYNASGGTYIYAAFAEAPFGGSGVSQSRAR